MWTQLPELIQRLSGRTGQRALQLLGYYMLGWRDAESQRDIAELIDFLHPRWSRGSWQGRRQGMQGGLERTDPASLPQCIPLTPPPQHNPELQHLVNHWHQQEYRQALVETGPWLFLQLPRFQYRSGRVTKTRQMCHIPHVVQMPLFSSSTSLAVQWLPYRITAVVRHHGSAPHSGHYTSLIAADGEFQVFDDRKSVRVATEAECSKACRDMYIILLTRDSQDFRESAAALTRDFGSVDSPLGGHGHAVAMQHATARGRVDRQSAVSSRETAGAPLSGHEQTPSVPQTGIERYFPRRA